MQTTPSSVIDLRHGLSTVGFITIVLASALAGCDSNAPDSAMPGEALFAEPHPDGNTFACATCHALEEPASDGLTRPGHELGTAASRPTFKNGQLTELRDAVNVCRTEWMAAVPFEETDERWLALNAFLEDQAPPTADPIVIEVVEPVDDFSDGDPMNGREIFNRTCVVCHGTDGTGTQRAPKITGRDLPTDLIAGRVRLSGRPDSAVYDGLAGGRMPFWGADRLSDAELVDLATYVNVSADGAVDPVAPEPVVDPNLRTCDSTSPRIGETAILDGFSHDVAGTATIVDDCTIEIEDFVFDGGGINIQIYGALGGEFDPAPAGSGFSMSGNLLGQAFDGETLTVQLPADRTLDDIDSISVWCVPVGADFGSGDFR